VAVPLSAAVMNTELTALNGSKFKLADYSGKVVIVNLWATWCGPCRSEIPDLVKLSEEFKLKGVELIGLTNEDPEMDKDKVEDFVRQFKIPYKIGWGDQNFALALMQGQVKNSIPQSFVISRDGRVLTRFVGYNPIETPQKIRRAVEDALNEKKS
jgi:thiol-disulfide isomerase/thioredoxin